MQCAIVLLKYNACIMISSHNLLQQKMTSNHCNDFLQVCQMVAFQGNPTEPLLWLGKPAAILLCSPGTTGHALLQVGQNIHSLFAGIPYSCLPTGEQLSWTG